jgi:hypothetical protein
MPVVSTSLSGGLSATLDLTNSRDGDEPASNLQVRFDWDDDGVADTGWLPNAPVDTLLRSSSGQEIGIQVKDSNGHVSSTRRRPTGQNALVASPAIVAASAPVNVQITLDAGPAAAGKTYLILGSVSGASPATPWFPGFDVPLVPDPITDALFIAANTPVFQNSYSTLDGSGQAVATFSLPAGVLNILAFRTLSWAAIGAGPSGSPAFVAGPSGTVIFP